jgi:putative transposase
MAKPIVATYMVPPRRPPFPTRHAFLRNHIKEILAADFLVVPTVRDQVLFVILVLAHERRRIPHFNVTSNPTAAWTAQQIVEAFPWDDVPRYLLRDRHTIFGTWFARRVENIGIDQIVATPRSPWQNAYVGRLIGTIRRECLDHVIRSWSHRRDPEIGGLHHHYQRIAA